MATERAQSARKAIRWQTTTLRPGCDVTRTFWELGPFTNARLLVVVVFSSLIQIAIQTASGESPKELSENQNRKGEVAGLGQLRNRSAQANMLKVTTA